MTVSITTPITAAICAKDTASRNPISMTTILLVPSYETFARDTCASLK